MEEFGRINLNAEQLASLDTPCYVVNVTRLEDNLKLLHHVETAAGCKVLLAFKGFAMWRTAPLVNKYLSGVSASSVNEASLGHEFYSGDLHVYSPAYSAEELKQHITMANHIVFNSISQWNKHKKVMAKHPDIECALRINPEQTESEHAIYDPSGVFSRLGTTIANFKAGEQDLEGITGLHFHNLCEMNVDALERTLAKVEEQFAYYFKHLTWINFGGGHHITRKDYDVDRLIQVIRRFKKKYDLEVYLEPGEAIGLNTGVLVSQVMDVFENGMPIAILDASATCHMPDILEMPYRPFILNAGEAQEKALTYRLGGPSCLAGDVIGDYSFDFSLKEGDYLVFGDMVHYTMVKTTTFNGINLPSIYLYDEQKNDLQLVKSFGYEDYKSRLS